MHYTYHTTIKMKPTDVKTNIYIYIYYIYIYIISSKYVISSMIFKRSFERLQKTTSKNTVLDTKVELYSEKEI